MCGIFSIFNYNAFKKSGIQTIISDAFYKSQHRGPDNSTLMFDSITNACFGFHRLTINGVSNYFGSNQPIHKNNILLLCNGEIYNYKTLLNEIDLSDEEKRLHSGSDCEIIIDLYLKYGMDTTLELLDGVFAFILLDLRCIAEHTLHKSPLLYVARDPFGLRPLYWLKHKNELFDNVDTDHKTLPFGFASELKQLVPILNTFNENDALLEIVPFLPGHYVCYTGDKTNPNTIFSENLYSWFIENSRITMTKYFQFPHFRDISINTEFTKTLSKIRMYLECAVEKRVHTTDRPIACLLSGGVDSSLICALVTKYLPKGIQLETYSIGMEGSSDEHYVKLVSEHIHSFHTHVKCSKEEFLQAIPDVIQLLETYDITTVRASVGNYLIGKYISQHSNAKVIFNGDGSDELFGGYKYFLNCPNKYEFHKERKRLLTDIHYFDVLRSEKSISVNGLEARTPFLDKQLVSFVMTLTSDLTFTPQHMSSIETELFNNDEERYHCVFDAMKQTGIEKYMLRHAFKDTTLLPESILMRSKEAFSDGVSSEDDSWYITIQKFVVKELMKSDCLTIEINDLLQKCIGYLNGETTYSSVASYMIELEKGFYKSLFECCYGKNIVPIPYYWMPKYTSETSDPSARTLTIYSKTVDETK